MGHFTDHNHDPKPSSNTEVKALTKEIINLFLQLQKRTEFDEEKQWLRAHCQNPVLLMLLGSMTTLKIHVLDTIGLFQPVNGSTISKHMDVPKGTVSKITRRLVTNELILTEFLPDNKKEILFRLTPSGQELFELHQTLHQKIEAGVEKLYQKYDVGELRLIVKFLKDGLKSPWIDPDSNE